MNTRCETTLAQQMYYVPNLLYDLFAKRDQNTLKMMLIPATIFQITDDDDDDNEMK